MRDVFVYDFWTRRWTDGVDMPSNRSFFAVGTCDGKVHVAGGHDEGKNALKSAWVYDIAADEWTMLAPMSEERDECEGLFVGSEFWVVSGYETESQGRFKSTANVLETMTGTWRRLESVWGIGRCPRACFTVWQNGSFNCRGDSDTTIQVGACVVDLGDRTMITASSYWGGPQTFIVAEKDEQGESNKPVKVDAPDEFSGFVQSGCFVEI
ncbi:hypothetical protein L1987_28002 [Smallanthus sonchifolius]|uniref:Uncharacterized protein n=1 Tax=Smallanthus sonchifolius TaxID=185202 RepID=A0ACB9IDS2_9ASTR|nr:hypothetical protein L1987_28002 [Smallanthus sonchifolius]